jgi:hypothetical protein
MILPPVTQVTAQEESTMGVPAVAYNGEVTKVIVPVPEPNAVGVPTTPLIGAFVEEMLLAGPQNANAGPQVAMPTSVIVPRPTTNVN